MESGLSAAKLLWPEFKLVDNLIFFLWAAPGCVDLEKWHNRTDFESSINHTHVLDCFAHSANLSEEPHWNQYHPDFLAACIFGRRWAEMVASKLARNFPERSFFVYYTEQDNPIVRFHQQHPGELPWMSAENFSTQIASGEVIIHCVSATNTAMNPSDVQ